MTNTNELTAAWKAVSRLKYSMDVKKFIDLKTIEYALHKQSDRIAELEARTLTVKLPQRYSMLHRLDFDEPYHTEMVYKQSEVLEVLAAAGIKLQVEGEE